MLTVRLPTRTRGSTHTEADHAADGWRSSGTEATELVDLYAAIAVAVPLAFLLRWLWP